MAERNHIKDRLCTKCNDTIRGKAHALKEHAKQCDGKKQEKAIIELHDYFKA